MIEKNQKISFDLAAEANNDFSNIEDVWESHSINFSNDKIDELKKEIIRLLFVGIFRNVSEYRELFATYYKQIGTNEFTQKIIFKLSKIIEKEVNLEKYKVFFVARTNSKALSDDTYLLPLEIAIINNSGVVAKWKQDFIYINILQSKLDFLPVDVIKEAENFFLSFNKSMFYDNTGWRGANLLVFIKGKLEEISLDFKVEPYYQNMYLKLRDIDFKIIVSWNGEWVFDVSIGEKATHLLYYGKNNRQDRSVSNQTFPDNFKFKNSEGFAYASAILDKIKEEFQGFWSIYDTVGDLVKTAKYLLSKQYGQIAQYIVITTNKDRKTQLLSILNDDLPDFNWQIIFCAEHWHMQNLKYKIIRVKNLDMAKKIPTLISQININDYFPIKGITLFNIIKCELNKLSYNFDIYTKYDNLNKNQKLADIDFYVIVKFGDKWVCDINLYLKYHGKKWIFNFPDDSENVKIPLKTEL